MIWKRLAAIAVAVLLLVPGAVRAGACIETVRSSNSAKPPSADTNVKNQTKAQRMRVEIYRGGTEKASHWIGPGEAVRFLGAINNDGGGGTFRAQIYPSNALIGTECAYKVRWREGSGNYYWQLLEGKDQACGKTDGIVVACDKSFQGGKMRWTTTFTVTDPAEGQ